MEIKNSTFFFLFSIPSRLILYKDLVDVELKHESEIIKSEMITILEKVQIYINKKFTHTINLKELNIYISKYELIPKENEEIKIKINYFKKDLISSKHYDILPMENKFFFFEEFKLNQLSRVVSEKIFEENVKNFLDKNYEINYFQKYLIYKGYLTSNKLNSLFNDLYKSVSYNIKKYNNDLDYEYILVFFIDLLNNKNEYNELSDFQINIITENISN